MYDNQFIVYFLNRNHKKKIFIFKILCEKICQ